MYDRITDEERRWWEQAGQMPRYTEPAIKVQRLPDSGVHQIRVELLVDDAFLLAYPEFQKRLQQVLTIEVGRLIARETRQPKPPVPGELSDEQRRRIRDLDALRSITTGRDMPMETPTPKLPVTPEERAAAVLAKVRKDLRGKRK